MNVYEKRWPVYIDTGIKNAAQKKAKVLGVSLKTLSEVALYGAVKLTKEEFFERYAQMKTEA